MDNTDRRKKMDEIMEKTQAMASWVLICLDDDTVDGKMSDIIATPTAQRNPFARVVSVGELCKSGVKPNDRITYKEGVNIKELEGVTRKKFLYVWEPNICGRAPRPEELAAKPEEKVP